MALRVSAVGARAVEFRFATQRLGDTVSRLPRPEEERVLGTTVSHYRIVRELGAGGMGVVYEAEDTRLRRNVAVKFLSSALAQDAPMLERFEREARAASSLSHPGICTVHAIEQHAGQSFIVMELVEGESLSTMIAGGADGDRAAPGSRHPDGRCPRSGACEGHRPPRPEADEHDGDAARPGEDPRLRPGEVRARGRGEPSDAHAHRGSAGGSDRRGDRVRHGPLHVARAGARADDRRAHRPLLARRDPLPDGHRRSALRGGHAGGGLRRDPEPRPAAAFGGEPGDAAGARADPGEGPREGPQPPLPDGDGAEDRPPPAAAQARSEQVGPDGLRSGRRLESAGQAGGALDRRPLLRESLGSEGGRVPAGRHHRGHPDRPLEDQGTERLPAHRRCSPSATRRRPRRTSAGSCGPTTRSRGACAAPGTG